jgi:hypothetical protein
VVSSNDGCFFGRWVSSSYLNTISTLPMEQLDLLSDGHALRSYRQSTSSSSGFDNNSYVISFTDIPDECDRFSKDNEHSAELGVK